MPPELPGDIVTLIPVKVLISAVDIWVLIVLISTGHFAKESIEQN